MMLPIFPRHLFRRLLLALGFSLGMVLAILPALPTQAQTDTDLFYRFNGEPIPLVVREDAIAVTFQEPSTLRSTPRTTSPIPLYQQLQADLDRTRTRDGAVLTVQPVGTHHAIIAVPQTSSTTRSTVRSRLRQPYIQATIPVLSLVNQAASEDYILLPNEIIVSFAPDTTAAEQAAILADQGLELIRPLRFSNTRVLARLQTLDHETGVLTAAEQLAQRADIQSATPNLITVRSQEAATPAPPLLPLSATPRRPSLDTPALSWHLDSTARRPNQGNTGVRAAAAWDVAGQGEGIVVAVLDSFIQWDHPALADHLYQVPAGQHGFAGEVHGWDFVDDDPDTRLEDREIAVLRPVFQGALTLSDSDLLLQHAAWAASLRMAPDRIPDHIRSAILQQLANSEFHGTTVAGVITARPTAQLDYTGIAPGATLLPVRVGNAHTGLSSVAIDEAIGYVAARGADVINLSFGSSLPAQNVADRITEVAAQNPNLVMVAAAGNGGSNQISFPAAFPDVIAVGASTLQGTRAPYSSFGPGLTLMAPGGDLSETLSEGILTTSGAGDSRLWQGLAQRNTPFPIPTAQDPRGYYVWTQGTSFASPVVAGVMALMQGADPQRTLNRDRLTALLESAASYDSLALSAEDQAFYRTLRDQGVVPADKPDLRYFFGSGLVDAETAVRLVQSSLR